MNPENWVGLTGIIATATISIFSVLWNTQIQKRLRDEQFLREDIIRKDYETKEVERQKIERIHSPQIEFDLSARFFGPEKEEYLLELRLNLTNSGLVQQKLWDPKLRILGIRKGVSLNFRAKDQYRLEFPEKILPLKDILPADYNYFFVEPGVHQDISYVTKVPSSVGYVLVYSEFHYNPTTPHTTERLFEVGKDFNSRTISS
jgi:hypothetical protein